MENVHVTDGLGTRPPSVVQGRATPAFRMFRVGTDGGLSAATVRSLASCVFDISLSDFVVIAIRYIGE